ncbi:MAG: ASPIC/UnbV domain-containing protein, partial [Planctomycetota bacterium]
LRLVGIRCDRDAVGARVLLTAGGRTQVREVAAGVGFCGGVEALARFGLGSASRVDRVEIRWPSGTVRVLEGVEANRVVRVVEG